MVMGFFTMSVLMVLIVSMSMIMLQRLVLVLMPMPFGQMQPDAHSHQCYGNHKGDGQPLVQDQQRNDRSNERSQREIGARPGCAEVSQRQDKESQTDPISEQTYHRRQHDGKKPWHRCASRKGEGLCCRNSHGDHLPVFLRCDTQENEGKVSSPQLERV